MTLDRGAILSSDKLPSLPAIALEILQLTRNPESDAKDIARVVKSDPALASKILRTVNSSPFGLRYEVSTIEQAVSLLGNVALSSLVLSFALLRQSTQPGPLAVQFQGYWLRSLIQGVACSELAKRSGGGVPSEYFVAGLLQDIGALAILKTAPEVYCDVLAECERSETPWLQIEQARLGLTHVEIGAEVCKRWGLPQRLQQAVAQHHRDLPAADSSEPVSTYDAATVTAGLIAEFFWRQPKQAGCDRLKAAAERFYRLRGDDLQNFLEQLHAKVTATAEAFSVDVGKIPSPEQILADAKEQLFVVAARVERDPVTGLFKQVDFQRQLQTQWQACIDSGRPIGLSVVDLDHFERIGRAWGQSISHQALRRVAHILEAKAGPAAVVGRCGPDDFGILLPGVDEAGLFELSEEIRRAIACEPISDGRRNVDVTASVGAVVRLPDEAFPDSAETFLQAAIQACAEAKSAGRNQVRVRSAVNAVPTAFASKR